MLTLSPAVHIYMADGSVDMRNGIDGLAGIVRNQWQLDIFSGHLFIFLSKRRDRIKVLYFERGGFVMWQKRLEEGQFARPAQVSEGGVLELDATDLSMMLEGIDIKKVKRPKRWAPTRSPPATKIAA